MNFAPAGPHLLDASAVILMSREGASAALEALLPFVTYGGLLAGVYRSTNPTLAGARLDAAVGIVSVLYPSRRTVNIYARYAAELRRSGRMIPTNDLWIAALALKRDLPVLTDDAHFARISGLNVLTWR